MCRHFRFQIIATNHQNNLKEEGKTLFFCNQHSANTSVAIMYLSPGCEFGAGDWMITGWWTMKPGSCINVFNEDLEDLNRFYCYFAVAADGGRWSGPIVRRVRNAAFQWCENTGTLDSFIAGFRVIDIGDNDDFTVNLVGRH
ncbi:MAG: DUF1036 domain-containing protein [Nitrososphaeraceae archaeon]